MLFSVHISLKGGAHTKLTSCTYFYLALGRTFFNDFLCSNICHWKQHVEKRDGGKINLCAMGVLPWLFQSSTHSLWDWYAVFSFNLLDVSTCCSLLQFVFNFKKLVYSFDAKHWQKFSRAPFPVEFLHCKRVGHSASAVRQVTPLEQGVPVHYTSRGCLFQERLTPSVLP